jgi:hypothetical protein
VINAARGTTPARAARRPARTVSSAVGGWANTRRMAEHDQRPSVVGYGAEQTHVVGVATDDTVQHDYVRRLNRSGRGHDVDAAPPGTAGEPGVLEQTPALLLVRTGQRRCAARSRPDRACGTGGRGGGRTGVPGGTSRTSPLSAAADGRWARSGASGRGARTAAEDVSDQVSTSAASRMFTCHTTAEKRTVDKWTWIGGATSANHHVAALGAVTLSGTGTILHLSRRRQSLSLA